MKSAFLISTLATATLAKQFDPCTSNYDCSTDEVCKQATGQTWSMCQPKPTGEQFSVCTDDSQCNHGFYCKPTNDNSFSMCQPKHFEELGKQFTVCKKNSDCGKGLFCKPTNDYTFSMCQPNEYCAKPYGQCDGYGFVGPSCCENGFVCKHFNDNYSQCVPATHAMHAQASCTNVSVKGDATYCLEGAVCGDSGDQCPKKGDIAVADCIKSLKSYVSAGKCVAPSDATCQTVKKAKICVFGASKSTEATIAPTTQGPTTNETAKVHNMGAQLASAEDIVQQLFDLHNTARQENGVEPFTCLDSTLSSLSMDHVNYEIEMGTISHDGFDERCTAGGNGFSCAENTLSTTDENPVAMMDMWMNSPGHRTNILDPNLNHAGFAVKMASDGTYYATAFFTLVDKECPQ